ncbi:hypothetical protein LCGC14_2257550 [marine sediment metagenome]|uniref:Uncharacterized protein n=1 Tax=marine sediment metagenome TaxID=412755 RepID=A0A0F9D108_9ZZZZ
MKKLIVVFVLLITVFANSTETVHQSTKDNGRAEPGALYTERFNWTIVESENSGDTQATNLAVTERTYQLVKAAIAAASSGDDNIAVFDIPRGWNSIRLRAIGITDNGTYTTQIYLGTLGDGNKDGNSTTADAELAYAGQLAWVVGTQSSIYSQIAYTSGGTRTIIPGDILTGATSGETAKVVSLTVTSGAFVDGDAAGTLTVRTQSGTFQSENLNLTDRDGTNPFLNVAAIGADMVRFEVADAVTITASDWVKSWVSKSPGSERVASAEIDLEGADVMIVVSTTASADSKLIAKGF